MNKQSYSFLTHLIPPSYIFLDNPLKIHATIIFQVNWLTNQDQLDKASPGNNCHMSIFIYPFNTWKISDTEISDQGGKRPETPHTAKIVETHLKEVLYLVFSFLSRSHHEADSF